MANYFDYADANPAKGPVRAHNVAEPVSYAQGKSIGMSIGGMAAASFGYLNPIVAAILHNVGSLFVVFNSARLVRQGEELEPFVQGDDAANPSTGTPAPQAA